MITVEIPDVQLHNPDSNENIVMNDIVAGVVAQHLANAVIDSLRNGSGFSIRDTNVEVKVTTTRIVENDVTETYIGQ